MNCNILNNLVIIGLCDEVGKNIEPFPLDYHYTMNTIKGHSLAKI